MKRITFTPPLSFRCARVLFFVLVPASNPTSQTDTFPTLSQVGPGMLLRLIPSRELIQHQVTTPIEISLRNECLCLLRAQLLTEPYSQRSLDVRRRERPRTVSIQRSEGLGNSKD